MIAPSRAGRAPEPIYPCPRTAVRAPHPDVLPSRGGSSCHAPARNVPVINGESTVEDAGKRRPPRARSPPASRTSCCPLLPPLAPLARPPCLRRLRPRPPSCGGFPPKPSPDSSPHRSSAACSEHRPTAASDPPHAHSGPEPHVSEHRPRCVLSRAPPDALYPPCAQFDRCVPLWRDRDRLVGAPGPRNAGFLLGRRRCPTDPLAGSSSTSGRSTAVQSSRSVDG